MTNGDGGIVLFLIFIVSAFMELIAGYLDGVMQYANELGAISNGIASLSFSLIVIGLICSFVDRKLVYG